ncbi:hypothetical protein QUC31_010873, partial [Theobroma cacao]
MKLTNKVGGDIAKTFASLPDERKLVFKNLVTVDRLRYLEEKKEFNAKVNKDYWDTRCSPFRFYKLLQNIGFKYNDSIRNMGLGGLIHLQEYKLNKDLYLWLIEMVDLNKRCLKLYDYEILLMFEM